MSRLLSPAKALRGLYCRSHITRAPSVTDLLGASHRTGSNKFICFMHALPEASMGHAAPRFNHATCISSSWNSIRAPHPATPTPRVYGASTLMDTGTFIRSRSQQRQHIRCFAAAKEKTVWVCSSCGKEHVQWVGRCTNCKGPVTAHILSPNPPKLSASGASRARQVLEDLSDGNYSGSGFESFNSSSMLYDRGYIGDNVVNPTGWSGARSSYSDSWVQGTAGGGIPQPLSDIAASQQQLRLPLLGPTGEEVARVLGGGLVPGSLVLVGGEPGMGKSTLLLQVAGLVAQACNTGSSSNSIQGQQQQEEEDVGSISEPEEDVPLSARLAAAAAVAQQSSTAHSSSSSSGSRSSGSTSWLDEAFDVVAAGAPVVVPAGLQGRPVLYITAEESKSQVLERAVRLGLNPSPLQEFVLLMEENRIERIIGTIKQLRPAAVVVDSIQTVSLSDVTGRPGGVTQVVECAACLMHVAKKLGIATFLVGHVTKAGTVAGPRKIEHLVDVVLYLQGAKQGQLRMLRASKNRHGRVGEVGLFEMRGAGLSAVKDAAALFAPATTAAAEAEAATGQLVGTAIGVVQEGIRPLPLEIQALATPRLQETPAARRDVSASDTDVKQTMADDDRTGAGFLEELPDGDGSSTSDDYGEGAGEDSTDYDDYEEDIGGIGLGSMLTQSRRKKHIGFAGVSAELAPLFRHYVGVQDKGRMAMLLELLTKYTPIKMHLHNLFINVVAGVRIGMGETSTDLAILAAITSSITNKPLPPGTALLAEVGLAGELRAVPNLELRLLELSKLGFSNVVVPAAGGPLTLATAELGGMHVHRVHTLKAALNHLFGEYTLKTAGWPRKKKEEDGSSVDSSSAADGSGRGGSSSSRGGEGSQQRITSSGGSTSNQQQRTRSSQR